MKFADELKAMVLSNMFPLLVKIIIFGKFYDDENENEHQNVS